MRPEKRPLDLVTERSLVTFKKSQLQTNGGQKNTVLGD